MKGKDFRADLETDSKRPILTIYGEKKEVTLRDQFGKEIKGRNTKDGIVFVLQK